MALTIDFVRKDLPEQININALYNRQEESVTFNIIPTAAPPVVEERKVPLVAMTKAVNGIVIVDGTVIDLSKISTERAKAGKYYKLDELKDIALVLKLRKSGKKSDLVDRIRDELTKRKLI